MLRSWRLGDYWLLVIWRAMPELDTTAHKLSAHEKRDDLWPLEGSHWISLSAPQQPPNCTSLSLSHCYIFFILWLTATADPSDIYHVFIFISRAGCISLTSLLTLTPSRPRFIALFAQTLFPLWAQSVDSQSISTLFLIGADAIKIIAVYEKQFCSEKM